MNKDERADHADRAGNARTEYLASKGEPHNQPAEGYEVSDLICVLHHADRLGFHHRDILSHDLMHYKGEKAEEGDQNRV